MFDPFSLEVWDALKNFPLSSALSTSSHDNSAFVTTRIDWKETPEAHVLRVDLPKVLLKL